MTRYFISYAHEQGSGVGIANCELSLHEPIRSLDDTREIAEFIAETEGLRNVTVMAFCRFDDPAETGTTTTTGHPLDKLSFEYIRQLLIEQQRPLSVGEIASTYGIPADAVNRIVQNAVTHGRFVKVGRGFIVAAGER